MRYIRRRIEVDALEITPTNHIELIQFAGKRAHDIYQIFGGGYGAMVTTTDGQKRVVNGDFVVKYSDNSLAVYSAERFHQEFEEE